MTRDPLWHGCACELLKIAAARRKKAPFESLVESLEARGAKTPRNLAGWIHGRKRLHKVAGDRLYHYLWDMNPSTVRTIKRRGLLPIDALKSDAELADYHGRGKSVQQIYKEHYQPVTKKEYANYGIYTTPIDFWRLRIKTLVNKAGKRLYVPDTRVSLAISAVTKPAVLEVGVRRKHFTETALRAADVRDPKKIEKAVRKSEFLFAKLPTVIDFSGRIPASKLRFERRSDAKV